MFDFSWSEILLVGAVALVVIGPKDLPKALKTAGTVVRKARGLAREFQNSIDDMIREAELDDIRRSVQQVTAGSLDQKISNAIDPEGHLSQPLFMPPPNPETPMLPLHPPVEPVVGEPVPQVPEEPVSTTAPVPNEAPKSPPAP